MVQLDTENSTKSDILSRITDVSYNRTSRDKMRRAESWAPKINAYTYVYCIVKVAQCPLMDKEVKQNMLHACYRT